jgi:hypothetical protein
MRYVRIFQCPLASNERCGVAANVNFEAVVACLKYMHKLFKGIENMKNRSVTCFEIRTEYVPNTKVVLPAFFQERLICAVSVFETALEPNGFC